MSSDCLCCCCRLCKSIIAHSMVESQGAVSAWPSHIIVKHAFSIEKLKVQMLSSTAAGPVSRCAAAAGRTGAPAAFALAPVMHAGVYAVPSVACSTAQGVLCLPSQLGVYSLCMFMWHHHLYALPG